MPTLTYGAQVTIDRQHGVSDMQLADELGRPVPYLLLTEDDRLTLARALIAGTGLALVDAAAVRPKLSLEDRNGLIHEAIYDSYRRGEDYGETIGRVINALPVEPNYIDAEDLWELINEYGRLCMNRDDAAWPIAHEIREMLGLPGCWYQRRW